MILIFYLLVQKFVDEKWVVLVNEFGEVGIDGVLLVDSGVLFKEIFGGCMCCVNGLLMQVGLNILLCQGKFDCLLIEFIGLGYLKQIFDIFIVVVYEFWIDLCVMLCIFDFCQLLDERVVSNDNFCDQLVVVDIIVVNKSDWEIVESVWVLVDWWQCWGGECCKVLVIQGNIDLILFDEL